MAIKGFGKSSTRISLNVSCISLCRREPPISPPEGAPNVLVILLDDVGFGAASVFGGPCRTPTAERLASNGLAYSRFHTAALCAPTRQALLTGRNHHAVGMGAITEVATAAPGYTSIRPQSAAPLAEVLRLIGPLELHHLAIAARDEALARWCLPPT